MWVRARPAGRRGAGRRREVGQALHRSGGVEDAGCDRVGLRKAVGVSLGMWLVMHLTPENREKALAWMQGHEEAPDTLVAQPADTTKKR